MNVLTALLLCLVQDPAEATKALEPLGKLVGSYSFKKTGYEKTFSVEWGATKTIVFWRSKTVVGKETVFEDLMVFSYDPKGKRLRARQWAHGALSTYDVEVKEKEIVLTEVETEGEKDAPWRYRIAFTEAGFKYLVEQKAGDEFTPYISHSVTRDK